MTGEGGGNDLDSCSLITRPNSVIFELATIWYFFDSARQIEIPAHRLSNSCRCRPTKRKLVFVRSNETGNISFNRMRSNGILF